MNLVTMIGKVYAISDNELIIDIDDKKYEIQYCKNKTPSFTDGDIVGIIGNIIENNKIWAKHISVF